jgi:hypothetical protein
MAIRCRFDDHPEDGDADDAGACRFSCWLLLDAGVTL